MKSNELRIGNYLHDRNDNLCKVIELRADGIYAPAVDLAITGLPNKPIELTEKWLLKLGFRKELESDSAIFYENDFLSINTYKGYNSTFLKRNRLLNQQDYSINNIEYVHHLQNLYFVLTGEELTIKE